MINQKNGRTHAIIPDTQCKPGVPLQHLKWAGQYLARKKPDVIIHLGDHWDMPSLSSYDRGTLGYEGRRYVDDIEAGINGMKLLMDPILKAIKDSKGTWKPKLIFLMGNHEQRIERAIQQDRKLEQLIGYKDLKLKEFGWTVYNFLEVVQIDGICYSHYFVSGAMGRPIGSAAALITKKHCSCVMGHIQKTEMSLGQTNAKGDPLLGLFAGFYYQHDEDYLGKQGNPKQRQIWLLREVKNGFGYPQAIPLEYLKRRFSPKQRNKAMTLKNKNRKGVIKKKS